MDALSPDIAKKLLSRNLANLAQRIQRGEKLSEAELLLLQNMAAQAGDEMVPLDEVQLSLVSEGETTVPVLGSSP